jgi:hypothetical protein
MKLFVLAFVLVLVSGLLAQAQTSQTPQDPKKITTEQRYAIAKLQVRQQALVIQQYQVQMQINELKAQLEEEMNQARGTCPDGLALRANGAGDLDCLPDPEKAIQGPNSKPDPRKAIRGPNALPKTKEKQK